MNAPFAVGPDLLALAAEESAGVLYITDLARKDGSTFLSALAIAPMHEACGAVVGFLTNCIDITPAKVAE